MMNIFRDQAIQLGCCEVQWQTHVSRGRFSSPIAADGKVFMVIEAAARIRGVVPAPLARIYMKDYDVEERGPSPWVECPSFRSDDADIAEARKVYRPVFAQPITHTNGLRTLEELITSLPAINVLGLEEGAAVASSRAL